MVCQGHTLESAKALPKSLVNAIIEAQEKGLLGVEAYRMSEYRSYRMKAAESAKPHEILSPMEFIPPAWATEEDVDEARDQRMEAIFDAE